MQIPTISFASEMERRANLEAALEDMGFMSLSDTGIEIAQSARYLRRVAVFSSVPTSSNSASVIVAPGITLVTSLWVWNHWTPTGHRILETLTVRNPLARSGEHWPSAGLRDLLLDFYQRCLVVAYKLQADAELYWAYPAITFSHASQARTNLQLCTTRPWPLGSPGNSCRSAHGLWTTHFSIPGSGRWSGGVGSEK